MEGKRIFASRYNLNRIQFSYFILFSSILFYSFI